MTHGFVNVLLANLTPLRVDAVEHYSLSVIQVRVTVPGFSMLFLFG